MKKIMLSLATVLAFAFTACDPVEDFTKNTASNYSKEQIDATLIQNGGDNLVEVTVHSNATAQISNGKQNFKANYAKVVMRELGETSSTSSFSTPTVLLPNVSIPSKLPT